MKIDPKYLAQLNARKPSRSSQNEITTVKCLTCGDERWVSEWEIWNADQSKIDAIKWLGWQELQRLFFEDHIFTYPTGATAPCPKCNNGNQSTALALSTPAGQKLAHFYGVPPYHAGCTLAWFDSLPSELKAGKEKAREYAGALSQGYEIEGKKGVIFSGVGGMGKSGLAAGLCADLLGNTAIKPAWIDFNQFMGDVYSAQAEKRDPHGFIRQLSLSPFLVIDDLGDLERTEPITQYQRDCIYDLIRPRYESQLPTVITTNLTQQQLYDHYGSRIAQRILDLGIWCEMTGAILRF